MVTLFRKLIFFQKGIYSSRICLPEAGALGRISSAGSSSRVLRQQFQVTSSITAVYTSTTVNASGQLTVRTTSGCIFSMMQYALQMIRGNTVQPARIPKPQPRTAPLPE